MANLRSALALVVGMVMGAVLVLMHQIFQVQEKSLLAALGDVPGAAKKILGEVRTRTRGKADARCETRGASTAETEEHSRGDE